MSADIGRTLGSLSIFEVESQSGMEMEYTG